MARLQDVLRRIIAEMDDEEAKDELRDLRDQLSAGKKVTVQDIRDAISEAPPEERAALRELLAEELDDTAPPPATDDDANGGKRKRKKEPAKPPASTRRTRPGRKSGAAYDWYVDDDGKVVRSNVATIYSGEDEPDEVEMFPDDDDTTGGDDDGSKPDGGEDE